MAYTHDNRLKFFIKYMIDITEKGTVHRDDFELVAFKASVLASRGNFNQNDFNLNMKIMDDFYTELESFAGFKRGKRISTEEFQGGLKKFVTGKSFKDMPKGLKVFMTVAFNSIDLNGDGIVGIDEFRLNCATRYAQKSIDEIDTSYNKLVTEADKKIGGINNARYEELYAEFVGSPNDSAKGVHLFGPLKEI